MVSLWVHLGKVKNYQRNRWQLNYIFMQSNIFTNIFLMTGKGVLSWERLLTFFTFEFSFLLRDFCFGSYLSFIVWEVIRFFYQQCFVLIFISWNVLVFRLFIYVDILRFCFLLFWYKFWGWISAICWFKSSISKQK